METFTYKVRSIDVTQGTMVIDYIPDDANLTPVPINTMVYEKSYMDLKDADGNLIYTDQASVPFSVHLEYTINASAPQDVWKRQKNFINNMSLLQSLPK